MSATKIYDVFSRKNNSAEKQKYLLKQFFYEIHIAKFFCAAAESLLISKKAINSIGRNICSKANEFLPYGRHICISVEILC